LIIIEQHFRAIGR
jgi:hypothetical protein